MSYKIFHKLPLGTVMLDSNTTCDTSIVKSVVCDDYLCVSKLEWDLGGNNHIRRYYITRNKNSSYEYRNLAKHQDAEKMFEDRKNLNTAMCTPAARYLYEDTPGNLVAKATPWIQIGDRIIDEFDITFNKCDDNLCITQVDKADFTNITYKKHDRVLYDRLRKSVPVLRQSKTPDIKLSNLAEDKLPTFYGMTPDSFTRHGDNFTINYQGCNFQTHKMHLTKGYLNRD